LIIPKDMTALAMMAYLEPLPNPKMSRNNRRTHLPDVELDAGHSLETPAARVELLRRSRGRILGAIGGRALSCPWATPGSGLQPLAEVVFATTISPPASAP
jgi:hypothetical protein